MKLFRKWIANTSEFIKTNKYHPNLFIFSYVQFRLTFLKWAINICDIKLDIHKILAADGKTFHFFLLSSPF